MKETFEIWWIRHGPTHAKTMVGWSDIRADLSDTKTNERISAILPKDLPVISSDLRRTMETATAIAPDHRPLAPCRDLREMHFGEWEMKAHSEIEAQEPERIRAFWETPGDVRPPGGESWNDMSSRVENAVARLGAAHGSMVIVAHFGVILSQLQRAMNWSGDETFAQRIDPLSLTRITYGTPRSVSAINQAP